MNKPSLLRAAALATVVAAASSFATAASANPLNLFSVPLHRAHWTEFDDYVGHARRYELAELQELIGQHGLVVEKSVVYGMQSNSPRLLHHAVQGMIRHPVAALRCYNWLFFPLGMLFQGRLKFTEGLMDLTGVHEVLLLCRKG